MLNGIRPCLAGMREQGKHATILRWARCWNCSWSKHTNREVICAVWRAGGNGSTSFWAICLCGMNNYFCTHTTQFHVETGIFDFLHSTNKFTCFRQAASKRCFLNSFEKKLSFWRQVASKRYIFEQFWRKIAIWAWGCFKKGSFKCSFDKKL